MAPLEKKIEKRIAEVILNNTGYSTMKIPGSVGEFITMRIIIHKDKWNHSFNVDICIEIQSSTGETYATIVPIPKDINNDFNNGEKIAVTLIRM